MVKYRYLLNKYSLLNPIIFLATFAYILLYANFALGQDLEKRGDSEIKMQSPLGGFVNPSNTGHPFYQIFICTTAVDSIQAMNLGTTTITLKQIDIINQNPSGTPQFSFINGNQTLRVDTLFRRGDRRNYIVIYTPTIEGTVSATIQCTWDSAEQKTLYSSNTLTGEAMIDHDTLSPSQILFTANTQTIIDVPINLSKELPIRDNAMGLSFKVTYQSNLLELMKSNIADYNSTITDEDIPRIVKDGSGNETVTFTLKSSVPITILFPVLTLHFTANASTDTTTPIIVSNVKFWGANPQDTLCYILTSATSAQIHITDSNEVSNSVRVVTGADREITILSDDLPASDGSIHIFTLLGAEITSWQGTISGNFRRTLTLPTSGVYFVKVFIGGKEYLFKKVL